MQKMNFMSKINVKTDSDLLFYNLFGNKTGKDFGYDIKQVTQGCKRTNIFTNENVVASVALMSSVAIAFLNENCSQDFYNIKRILIGFFVNEISWPDFVRTNWEIQKNTNLSNKFFDDMLTYIESNSADIMLTIDTVPFDISYVCLAAKYQ